MVGKLSLVLVLVALALAMSACDDTSSVSGMSVPEQLYVVDHGSSPSDDSEVAPYGNALARVRVACTNTNKQLGNMAVFAIDTIKKKTGRAFTTLDILHVVAAGEGTEPHACQSDFAVAELLIQSNS